MKLTILTIIFIFLLAFAVSVSAQDDEFPKDFSFGGILGQKKVKNLKLGFSTPNELKGYEFFSKGKLKDLKLGISTIKDVEKIFGKKCESLCDYDEKWNISFTYFKNITKESSVDDKKIKYIPDSKYLNTLYSISLYPKKRISFNNFNFPSTFKQSSEFAVGHDFDLKAVGSSYEVFQDAYGLSYTIYEKLEYSTKKVETKSKKGDLISIDYEIPTELEDTLFVEQK